MTKRPKNYSAKKLDEAFGLFTEIGILNQLSRTILENQLPSGLKMIHFSVLNNLSRRGDGRAPSDLAQTFQVPRSHMSDVLATMEKKGCIRFKASNVDGRSKLVYLTEKGSSVKSRTISRSRETLKDLGNRFDLNRLIEMRDELAELRQVMDEMRSS